MCQYCSPDNNESLMDYTFNKEKGRREFILDGMAAAGGLAAAMSLPNQAFAAVPEMPEDEVVRIGYLPITDASALLVAHAMGFFEDEGLKVEKPTLIRGWSPLIEGFAAHKFNLVHFLKPIPIWMRYNNNFPVKITGWAHTNGSGLVVGKHKKGVNSFAELGGSQIAVPYWYSMHNIVLQMALKNAGLEPVIQSQKEPLKPNQVNLQIMPPPDMPPALAARKIDAYIVAEPFNAAGEVLAGAKMLRFTGDIWKNHPCCVVCMHDEHTEKKKVWSQKVMNAVVRGAVYAQENKEEVAHMLSREGKKYLPMKAKVVLKAMTDYNPVEYQNPDAIKHEDWDVGRIDFNPYPYPSATKFIIDQLKETKVTGDISFLKDLDTEFVANDLVNYEYVKNAMDKYGVWDKVKGVDPANPTVREEVFEL